MQPSVAAVRCKAVRCTAQSLRGRTDGLRRVVIGINSFGPREGPSEQELPQHSAAFKRYLKLQQLERMLKDMPPDKRSALIGNAKAKVAARHAAKKESA